MGSAAYYRLTRVHLGNINLAFGSKHCVLVQNTTKQALQTTPTRDAAFPFFIENEFVFHDKDVELRMGVAL